MRLIAIALALGLAGCQPRLLDEQVKRTRDFCSANDLDVRFYRNTETGGISSIWCEPKGAAK